ncbi:MAG: hypothetical protein L6R41_008268 [Letrouitia leprolyta]|nr:MAG: hypothetical protein L6R41_008268 [Letrouitia leprolyta]
MLERQQAQLIAGIKGLHQMNQNDERLPAEPLETNKNNQPLVHQILQRLGILKTDDPWDEIEPEIGEADSQITEPDAVADPITIPECPYTWPGFSNAGNNSIPQAWKDIKHISTGLSLPGNAAPSPSAGIPFYQFLSAENLQFLKANGPLATNFADGGIPSRSWFESVAMVEPTREPFSQPHSNCLVADPSQFAYPDINQPASLSSGRRFGGENMTSQIDGATGQFFYR